MQLTLEEEIKLALKEAEMLGMTDKDKILETAQRLSGAPYSFVEQVYEQNRS